MSNETMQRFRKKPVVIQAKQWRNHGDHPAVEVYGYRRSGADPHGLSICAKCGGDMHMKIGQQVMHTHGWVETLEGGHIACPGDWIITGIKGEHYPCKPDIFEATYEPESAAGRRDAVPEWLPDVARCLEDVATQQRAYGLGDERMQQLLARINAYRFMLTAAQQEKSDG